MLNKAPHKTHAEQAHETSAARKPKMESFAKNKDAFRAYWKGLTEPQQAAMIGSTTSNEYSGPALEALAEAGESRQALTTLVNKYYAGNAPQFMSPDAAGTTAWFAKVGV